MVRAIIRISLTVTLICCSGTMATAADDLYRAQAIVTGQQANHIVGFAACLEDVLIKVSARRSLPATVDWRPTVRTRKISWEHLAITTKCPASDSRRAGHPRPAIRPDRRL
jgi:hypothetical protein